MGWAWLWAGPTAVAFGAGWLARRRISELADLAAEGHVLMSQQHQLSARGHLVARQHRQATQQTTDEQVDSRNGLRGARNG